MVESRSLAIECDDRARVELERAAIWMLKDKYGLAELNLTRNSPKLNPTSNWSARFGSCCPSRSKRRFTHTLLQPQQSIVEFSGFRVRGRRRLSIINALQTSVTQGIFMETNDHAFVDSPTIRLHPVVEAADSAVQTLRSNILGDRFIYMGVREHEIGSHEESSTYA